MISPTSIQQLARRFFPEVQAIRRHLHAHPELSFEEHHTASYISTQLTQHGISHRGEIAGTGIVAEIEGRNPSSRLIALRADMDALPILEKNSVEYRSRNPGIMHACGHDAHTACALGAAFILQQTKAQWEGTVRLIFQPGEEKLPGGASLMIEEGVLRDPTPAHILGQHVFPELESGKVGFRSGMYMASTDELYLTVKGKGGHAALPAQYNNPLLIASAIVLRLQQLFMDPQQREIPEDVPTVLAFGKIEGRGATNVIPSEVYLEGTFRTMHEDWRKEAHARIARIAQETAALYGGEAVLRVEKGYPFLVNDPQVTAVMRAAAETYLGPENVVDLELRMTAEDFAWYSQVIPACFYRLGTGNKAKGIVSPVHTATFDIDEQSLETGMGLMAWLAIKQ